VTELEPAVSTILDQCLAVRAGEEVLVIVDDATREIGGALREGARARGADAVLALMNEREHDGTEPPRSIAAAMASCDVFIAPTSRSLSHTRARKLASDRGVRGATMPGVTAEMLARAMSADFALMQARSRALADALTLGERAILTCPRGTELVLELGGREGISDDGDLTAPGAFGNLPCGEGFIAPLSGQGTIAASSLAPLGLSDEPARLTVEAGHITAAAGGLGPEYLRRLQAHGESGTNLAELGVGTNERARLSGNVLEDEKILGTAHVAFGASAGIGGAVSVPIHLDVVVLEASLEIDGKPVLEGGLFVLG
jgi:leucyl aminopeptidase (aminopeptidase T)